MTNTEKPTGELNSKGKRLDKDGREIVDPRPMAPPVGYRPSPSLADQIRDMVRSESLRQAAEQAGYETFEEADDFEVGEDFDPSSPYEEQFEGTSAKELRNRLNQAQEAERAARNAPKEPKASEAPKPETPAEPPSDGS